jgi:hypothetical protein
MLIIRTGTINPSTNTTKKNRHKCLIGVGSFAPVGATSLPTVYFILSALNITLRVILTELVLSPLP